MEDEWIDAETLYQLWIAEGMVLSSDKREGETMTQVAESYMGELVHRSMVQVRFNDLESSLAKFKSCSLHDLMRDLSLFQAKAEDFFEAIDHREGNDFHHNCSVVSQIAKTRQLVVFYQDNYGGTKSNSYFTKKPYHEQYRSILLVNVVMRYRSWQTLLGSYLANFKLLRVLALENTTVGRPSAFGNLRYLSLWGSVLETFPWTHKLVLLQTLKLNLHNVINKSPMSSIDLGKLAYLRHLYLPPSYCFNLRENFKLRFNGLSKLEILENFDTKWCDIKDLSKLSCLRRLKLQAMGCYDVKEMFEYLPGIAFSSNSCILYLDLTIPNHEQLGFEYDPDMIRKLFWNHKFIFGRLNLEGKLPELSEIFVQQQQRNHTHIDVSLIRITMLILRYSLLEEDPMPVLEKIPTLRDLRLQFFAYKGTEMVCSAMGFPRLVGLNLSYLTNLEKWRVEEGSMPILRNLQIYTCLELEELPEGLIFLHSLHNLTLMQMPLEFCNRVRLENGEQGPDFYKVSHVPNLSIEQPVF